MAPSPPALCASSGVRLDGPLWGRRIPGDLCSLPINRHGALLSIHVIDVRRLRRLALSARTPLAPACSRSQAWFTDLLPGSHFDPEVLLSMCVALRLGAAGLRSNTTSSAASGWTLTAGMHPKIWRYTRLGVAMGLRRSPALEIGRPGDQRHPRPRVGGRHWPTPPSWSATIFKGISTRMKCPPCAGSEGTLATTRLFTPLLKLALEDGKICR